MGSIEAPFPSDEWFSLLIAAAVADASLMEHLGIAELRFGVEVVAPSGEAQLFGIVLDGYDVTSLGTVDEAAFAPEVVVSGPLEAWVEMIEVIEAEGEADTAHTLNSLTIFGTPMMVRSPDAMGQDKFFRFMGTLQAIFDAAGSASVPVVG
jgi:predicted solute-binding protein